MEIEAHLPVELRDAKVSKIKEGLSGAGVYHVEHAGRHYVLKFSTAGALLQLVSDAGVAPRVIHADAETVTCEFVENKMFFGYLRQAPDQALDDLGAMLAKVHALPIPAGLAPRSKRWFLEHTTEQLGEFPRPAWFRDAVAEVLALVEPDPGPVVLSHNDVNPTNLVWDGNRVLLFDWDVAAPGDRYYDLASVSLFFQLDEANSLRLVSAHDGQALTALPARFRYDRQLVGAMVGTIFLRLAREGGHAGDANAPAPRLADVFAQLRDGKLDPATAAGQLALGFALLHASRS